MKKFLLTLTVVVCLVVGVGVIEASAGTYGKLTYEVSNGEVTITDCDSSVSGSITIPSSINGYPVTSIGDRAFYGRNSLTGVTIPDSVTSIGASAFCHCNSLSRVTIPNSVTTIEKEVFCCSGLTSVTIPNSVTTIGYNAFGNCNNLSSVIIPSSVTTIESLAFYNCSSLSRVTIPNSVTSIGDHAFYNCSSLTSVIIPDSVKSIGTCAFYRCTGLKNLTIGTGVETIDESAFCECTALEAINWNAINAILNLDEYDDNYVFDSCGTAGPGIILTFSDNVESIPKEAFHPKDISPKINTIIIGKNVKTVGRHAFGISLSKESVYINSFDEYLNIDFEDNSSFPTYNAKSIYVNNKLLTNVVFPSGTTTIYASLFGRNETITSVTIPNSVSKIDNKAFCYCSALKEINVIKTNSSYSSDEYGILYNKDKTTLITCPQSSTSTNISISKSVTTITDYAFSGCSSLVSVTIPDSVTSIGSYAFADCSSLTDVYYAGTKSEWAKISIGSYNTALTNATIHFKDNNAVTVIIDSVETTYGTFAEAINAANSAGKAVELKVLVNLNSESIASQYKHIIDLNSNTINALTVTGEAVIKNGTVNTLNVTGIAVTENVTVGNTNAVCSGTEGTKSVYTSCTLGVIMVDGAQVRIGGGITEDGTIGSGSGLRFIATVERTDTLAGKENAEFGILIYPADVTISDFGAEIKNNSTDIVVIPAKAFQDAGTDSIFSAALTNLKERNYNREFTAKPYVKIGNTYYTDGQKVTRSIYQVAAGLMATTDGAEGGDNADLQQMTDNAINVLNAYLNQVGIRLTISGIAADGTVTVRADGNGAYTGVPFFDIEESSKTGQDGVYKITLTAKGEKTTFKNFWKSYVRINNNNTTVIKGIDDANVTLSEDGKTLTFTFNYNTAIGG